MAWTVASQAILSMEFSRQEYWSRLPFPSPGNLTDTGIEPSLLHLLHWQADSLPAELLGKPQFVRRHRFFPGDRDLTRKDVQLALV